MDRAFDVQPHASDTWAMPSLDLKYSGDGWTLVSSSSYFYRYTQDVEDSTYGTQQILGGYYGVSGFPAQPYLWEGEHYHNQLTEELRIAFDPIHNRESGLSPKLALSYQAGEDVMVYSSASKGFRAGGAQAFAPFCAEPNLPVTPLRSMEEKWRSPAMS